MTDGKACVHLERLLPHQERGSQRQVKLLYTDKIEKIDNAEAYQVQTGLGPRKVNAFIKMLKKYGLQDYEIAILVDKFIYSKTLAEITEERGFTSPGVTFHLYKKAIDSLRSKGFKV